MQAFLWFVFISFIEKYNKNKDQQQQLQLIDFIYSLDEFNVFRRLFALLLFSAR